MTVFDRSSDCNRVLEEVWQELMKILPDLPPAIIVMARMYKGRSIVRGYFGPLNWRFTKENGHEIGVSITELGNDKELLAVLLHEAAHAINYARGIKDIGGGKEGYYHLKQFRETALELGLGCEFRNTRYGWTNTFYIESLQDRYSKILDILKQLSVNGVNPYSPPRPKALPKSGQAVYICKCSPPRRISMTENTDSQGAVICWVCVEPFTLRPTDITPRKQK